MQINTCRSTLLKESARIWAASAGAARSTPKTCLVRLFFLAQRGRLGPGGRSTQLEGRELLGRSTCGALLEYAVKES